MQKHTYRNHLKNRQKRTNQPTKNICLKLKENVTHVRQKL